METFTEISPQQAWELLQTEENAVLVDIRDNIRFTYSHPQGAFHLLDEVDYEDPIIVSCYHGNSSRNTAQFLVEQGFEQVYSLAGGFDAWMRAELPIETAYP